MTSASPAPIMTRTPWPAILLATLLLTAGCIQVDDDEDTPETDSIVPADETVLRLLEDLLITSHDHEDDALHGAFAYNAEAVAHLRLDEDGVGPASVGELDIRGDHAYVATFNPQAGFVIVDLSEPTEPAIAGRYDASTAYAADVKATDDGRWAFVATEPEAAFHSGTDLVNYTLDELPPTGTSVSGDFGLQLVDTSDKANPTLAWTHTADPLGYHMVDWMEIDGEIYVFGAVLPLGRVDILRLVEEPFPHLVPVSFYQHEDAQDPTTSFLQAEIEEATLVHDMTAETDPLDGFPLLTVSYWTLGAHFVDISNPEEPRLLGIWDDFQDAPWGNAHTAMVTRIENERVLVVSPEYRGLEQQGVIWIVNATDFTRPTLLSTWGLPGHLPFEHSYLFSPHNFHPIDGKLYLAHFHAGAYVLDISTMEKAAEPDVLAITLPAGGPPIDAPTLPSTPTPLIWDAIPHKGHYFLSDITGGLHVYRLHEEAGPTQAG